MPQCFRLHCALSLDHHFSHLLSADRSNRCCGAKKRNDHFVEIPAHAIEPPLRASLLRRVDQVGTDYRDQCRWRKLRLLRLVRQFLLEFNERRLRLFPCYPNVSLVGAPLMGEPVTPAVPIRPVLDPVSLFSLLLSFHHSPDTGRAGLCTRRHLLADNV